MLLVPFPTFTYSNLVSAAAVKSPALKLPPPLLPSGYRDEIVRGYDIKALKDKQYIRLTPRLEFPEHEDIKSYILISFDNFTTNGVNNRFRDCMVNFDIICHTNHWELDGLRVRPLMIAGYIDGILNFNKLSGVGEFIFLGCQELILNQELAGYTLSYEAVHFTEDDAKLEELSSK